MNDVTSETYLAKRQRYIATLWGRHSISRMARDLGLSRQRVSQIGKSLGLPPLGSSPKQLLPNLPPEQTPSLPIRPDSVPLPTGLPASGQPPARNKPIKPRRVRSQTAAAPEPPATNDSPTRSPTQTGQPSAHPMPEPPGQYSALPPPSDPLTRSIRKSLRQALRLHLTLPPRTPRAPELREAYREQTISNLLNRLSAAYALQDTAAWRAALRNPSTPAITDTVRWSYKSSPKSALYVPFASLFLISGECLRNLPLFRILPIQLCIAMDYNRPATRELLAVLALQRCFHDPSYRPYPAIESLRECGTPRAQSLAPLIEAAWCCNHRKTLEAAANHHTFLSGQLRKLSRANGPPTPRAFLDLTAAAAIYCCFHAPHTQPCRTPMPSIEYSPFFQLPWLRTATSECFTPPASRIMKLP